MWLLRDTGNESDAEQKDAPLGDAAAPGGDQDGAEGLSPGPSRRELVTKPGILPPTSRGQICQGAFEVHRGRKKNPPGVFLAAPPRGLASPVRGTTLPTPRIFPGAHAPGRFFASRRPRRFPDPSSEGSARQSLCARRPPGRTCLAPPAGAGRGGRGGGMGSCAWRRLAQCGRLQRRRPFRALQKECLGSGGSYNPLQSPTEQGHFLSPNPPIPHPLEEPGLGTPRL